MATILETVGGANFTAGFPGMIATGEPCQIDSFVNTSATALDFGILAVADTNDRSCKVMAADTDQMLGITVRHADMAATTAGVVSYAQYASVPVLIDGVIWVQAAEAVRRDDQVLAITAGGAGNTNLGSFGGSQGGVVGSGRVNVANAKWLDTTASGAIGRIRIKSVGTIRTTT